MTIDINRLDQVRARAHAILKRAPYRQLENWPEVRELAQSILDLADTVEADRIADLNVFGQPRNVPTSSSPTEAELLHIATAARRWITIRRLMAKRLENLGRPTEEILGDMRLTLIAESVGERDLDEALKAVGL